MGKVYKELFIFVYMENEKTTTKNNLSENDIISLQLCIFDSVDVSQGKKHYATARAKKRLYDMLEDILNNK